MTDTINSEFWMGEQTGGRRFMIAIFAGLLIEIAVLGAVIQFSHQQPPPSDHPTVVKLSIIAPAPPAPPAPKPPPPVPVPVPPKPVAPPPPVPMAPPVPLPPPPPRPAEHHVVTHRPPPPRPAPVSPPVQQAPPAPTPPPPPMPAAPSAGELDIFRAAMRDAVRRAAVTPSAAQMAHEAGVARVSFTFLDGAVSNISIIASSGFTLLDAAAMQAVRDARYPAEPADMRGQAETVQVDVIFRRVATSVDSD